MFSRCSVPVLIVQMLPDQSVRLYGTIGIHLRHIHVVNEVDQFLGTRRAIVATYMTKIIAIYGCIRLGLGLVLRG